MTVCGQVFALAESQQSSWWGSEGSGFGLNSVSEACTQYPDTTQVLVLEVRILYVRFP